MPRPAAISRRDYLAFGALAVLLAIAVTFQFRDARERFEQSYFADYPRFPIEGGIAGNRIEGVQPEAEKAGAKVGDYIVSVNGRPFGGTSDYLVPLRKARAGDVLVFGTRSTPAGPAEKEVAVTLAPFRSEPPTARDWLFIVTAAFGVSIVCIGLGFFATSVRVRDPQAWILLLVLLGFSRLVGGTAIAFWGYDDPLQPIGVIYMAAAEGAWPIGMILFGIYFGERLQLDRRFPWAKWLLLVPLLVADLSYATVMVLIAHHREAAAAVAPWSFGLRRPVLAFYLAGIIVFFVGNGYKAFTTSNADARRRLKLLHVGTLVSLAPFLLIFVRVLISGGDGFDGLPTWLTGAILAMLFLFPVTLAYVIVVQRAMDLRVVVRQGVQYVLARGGIRAIQLALAVTVSIAATLLLSGRAGIVRVSLVLAGMAAIVAIGGRFADRLRGWVDRRFFREAYNADQILSDLADQVRSFVETGPLLETVARRISESLHIVRVAVLIQPDDTFQPAYAVGYAEQPNVQIPERSATVERLRRERHLLVYPEDESSWIHRPEVTGNERGALRALESQLLLPLALNEKLLGILSLGPKQSEEPFSKTDLRLLDAVATQTGLALDNSRLAAAVAAEVAQRERINHELEIAREVQERLFPQELPPLDGLDYAGACRPARGVGGDYYDFIPLSTTELGIAIGDVSGKGIPAALLMAGLRASLRGQTIRRDHDLAQLMATVNQLVYESSSSNRYATFFYGEYNAASRRLRYVNAGHNPPMVFRRAGPVMRLPTGGPVVGMFPGCAYEQATVQLQPGDVFVAFTDGISEAMNARDEEWGEERLIECAGRLNGCAREGLVQIMAAADAFAAGANQYDDMTLILAYVK